MNGAVGAPEHAEVRSLPAPACSKPEHAGTDAWRSKDGKLWTCVACFGDPADRDGVFWGRDRG